MSPGIKAMTGGGTGGIGGNGGNGGPGGGGGIGGPGGIGLRNLQQHPPKCSKSKAMDVPPFKNGKAQLGLS